MANVLVRDALGAALEDTNRDFKSEIKAKQHSPIELRRLIKEMEASGAPRTLIIRALQAARKADSGPHPLGRVCGDLGLPRPEGLPLYRYRLAPGVFQRIQDKLAQDLHVDLLRPALAPAFVMWAADWFRRSYQGGPQRWLDIEKVLGFALPQGEWRKLADRGFSAWGIEPLCTAHGNQRLSNLARNGGFPAAAIAGGAIWPRRFLERSVGELLGAESQEISNAIAICERNEYLLPSIWRSQEMYAICGELVLKIVELRNFVDREAPNDGRSYSARLDAIYEDWRDELPMTLDGAAAGLIDTLLEAKTLSGTGGIRVARLKCLIGDEWRDSLAFHLDGRWEDKSRAFTPSENSRVFLLPSGALADEVSGRLSYLEFESGHCWISRTMRSDAPIPFSFGQPASAEFQARGVQIGQAFVLPGGNPVGQGLRIFEQRDAERSHCSFHLVGVGSGSYRAEPAFLECPSDWELQAEDAESHVDLEDFAFEADRRLFRCVGRVIATTPDGEKYLVRTGQRADRKDRLTVIGQQVSGVQAPDNQRLLKHPLYVEVEDGMSRRAAARGEVRWRFAGEKGWRDDLDNAGPGPCEFVWVHASTGHVRDRLRAIVLPEPFELTQRRSGRFTQIRLQGWTGDAFLADEQRDEEDAWKVFADPPRLALLPLRLKHEERAFDLNLPLRMKEWLTSWDGKLLDRGSTIGLADLSDTVARVPGSALLMGEVTQGRASTIEATWAVNDELGLSALRADIASLMRPLGIDAKVKLDFHNGSNDNWFVTEFGNSLEREPSGGLRPKIGIVGEDVQICGRSLSAPEIEKEFGPYDSLLGGTGAQPIWLPRLHGPWLIYLRSGSRVLTRPHYLVGDGENVVNQHRLGRVMAQPRDWAFDELGSLLDEVASDPLGGDGTPTIRAVLDLVVSLNGLPPQTFEVLKRIGGAGPLAPLLLYRCEEQHLTAILELFDGLCTSWTLLPVKAWVDAFQAQGAYLVDKLDDPQWVLTRMKEREDEVASRAPQLAPLLCRNYIAPTWDEVREHFTGHTSEAVRTDLDSSNPFRKKFAALLPDEHFIDALMRVFDAPFAAALAAMGRVELDDIQVLTVKEIERRHPDYFAKAYGYALSEYKNDCQ